jgi:RNA polymerase sigma factor (sigma-70 family)
MNRTEALIPGSGVRTMRVERDSMDSQINVAALKLGDEDAFRSAVDSLQDRVYKTCFGFLRNQHEAEDAAQEVFIEVYNSVKDFREEAQLSTWVHRIAVTKSIEAIRKKRRKKRLAFLLPDRSDEAEQFEVRDVSDSSNPVAVLENAERERVLRRALDALPDSQRVAFTLHNVEGMSYEEICKVMGNSLSSVESLIHRAKLNLKKRLYDYYSTSRE